MWLLNRITAVLSHKHDTQPDSTVSCDTTWASLWYTHHWWSSLHQPGHMDKGTADLTVTRSNMTLHWLPFPVQLIPFIATLLIDTVLLKLSCVQLYNTRTAQVHYMYMCSFWLAQTCFAEMVRGKSKDIKGHTCICKLATESSTLCPKHAQAGRGGGGRGGGVPL